MDKQQTQIRMKVIMGLCEAPSTARFAVTCLKRFGLFFGLVSEWEHYRYKAATYFTSVDDLFVDPNEMQAKVKMAENVAVSSLRQLDEKAVALGLPSLLPGIHTMRRPQLSACILNYVQFTVSLSGYADDMRDVA